MLRNVLKSIVASILVSIALIVILGMLMSTFEWIVTPLPARAQAILRPGILVVAVGAGLFVNGKLTSSASVGQKLLAMAVYVLVLPLALLVVGTLLYMAALVLNGVVPGPLRVRVL